MIGEAYAKLAETIFSWITDEEGLAAYKRRRRVEVLQKEIRNAIVCKNFVLAADKLLELQQLSNAV